MGLIRFAHGFAFAEKIEKFRFLGVNETEGADVDIFVKDSVVSLTQGKQIQWCY
jgi:hypothetical protein